MTNSLLAVDDQECNEPPLSPAQQRTICGRAQAYAYGLEVPRRLRKAWRVEFMRRWNIEDDTPVDLADIDAKIIARPVAAVPELPQAPVAFPEPSGDPRSSRGPPIDLNAIAAILFPDLSPKTRAIIAAGAFELLAEAEQDLATLGHPTEGWS